MAIEPIISADSHVFEPVNLWEERMERGYRDRAPRFVADYQGKPGTWFVCEGVALRSVASIAAVGIPKKELLKFQAAHYKDLRPAGYDPVERLKDQDIDGVSGEVLYAETEYSQQRYDRFWSAAEDIGLPISIHTLTSNRPPSYRYRGVGRAAAGYPKHRWKSC